MQCLRCFHLIFFSQKILCPKQKFCMKCETYFSEKKNIASASSAELVQKCKWFITKTRLFKYIENFITKK